MVHEDCSDPTKGCVPLATSWLTKEEFYTGLAAAQAMPGPLFNFSAYLGVCLKGGRGGCMRGGVGWRGGNVACRVYVHVYLCVCVCVCLFVCVCMGGEIAWHLTTSHPSIHPFVSHIPPHSPTPGAIVAQHTGYNAVLGIALCWLGLFGPGILLIFGVLPFWSKFRHWQFYRKYVCMGGA